MLVTATLSLLLGVQKVTEEIEKHLKTAEMLGFKGDTKGQKDQIVNELVRVHQRFQARINEYQLLLKMTIQFFQNLHQVSFRNKTVLNLVYYIVVFVGHQ